MRKMCRGTWRPAAVPPPSFSLWQPARMNRTAGAKQSFFESLKGIMRKVRRLKGEMVLQATEGQAPSPVWKSGRFKVQLSICPIPAALLPHLSIHTANERLQAKAGEQQDSRRGSPPAARLRDDRRGKANWS